MPASRFLKYTGRNWPNPVCSFYLSVSTSRDDPVACHDIVQKGSTASLLIIPTESQAKSDKSMAVRSVVRVAVCVGSVCYKLGLSTTLLFNNECDEHHCIPTNTNICSRLMQVTPIFYHMQATPIFYHQELHIPSKELHIPSKEPNISSTAQQRRVFYEQTPTFYIDRALYIDHKSPYIRLTTHEWTVNRFGCSTVWLHKNEIKIDSQPFWMQHGVTW